MTSDCIPGLGTLRADGYRVRNVEGTVLYVHRMAWEARNGVIPAGHAIHHRCMNRECVNLDHLDLLTNSDHSRLHNQPVTVCPKCVSDERRAIRTRPGKTYCLPCTRARDRARHRRRSMDAAQTRQAMAR